MLVRGQRRVLARRPARHEEVHALGDLPVDEMRERASSSEPSLVNGVISAVPTPRNIRDSYSNASSSNRTSPLRPRIFSAAKTAPRANPSRPRARCEISTRSSGESKKSVCRPNSAPTREAAIGGSSLPAAAVLHLGRDLQRRAAGRVFLLRVMALFHARGVLRKAREELSGAPREREHHVRAGREVRRVHAADARASRRARALRRARSFHPVVPMTRSSLLLARRGRARDRAPRRARSRSAPRRRRADRAIDVEDAHDLVPAPRVATRSTVLPILP